MTPRIQSIIVYLIGAVTLAVILFRLFRSRRKGGPCSGCKLKEHCRKMPDGKCGDFFGG